MDTEETLDLATDLAETLESLSAEQRERAIAGLSPHERDLLFQAETRRSMMAAMADGATLGLAPVAPCPTREREPERTVGFILPLDF